MCGTDIKVLVCERDRQTDKQSGGGKEKERERGGGKRVRGVGGWREGRPVGRDGLILEILKELTEFLHLIQIIPA